MSGADGRMPLLDWAIARRPTPGETACGDTAVVLSSHEATLIGVIDGLGHGPEAASVASIAAQTLREWVGESLVRLVELSHEALKGTRGVVMTLASFHAVDATMTWLGVGNVEGRLLHRKGRGDSIMLAGGIAGLELPRLQTATLPVTRGSMLVLATDGVRSSFADSLKASGSTQEIADGLLNKHIRGTDDALVLVARYLGENQ